MDELSFTGVPADGEGAGEELLPGGGAIRVTEENKSTYVGLLVEHFLVGFARTELSVLAEGFFELLPAKVLRADLHVPSLTALDLELICAGLPGIDVDDWRANTFWHSAGTRLGEYEYLALRDAFFSVLGRLDVEQRAKVLSFACGSGRLPAAGFKALTPPFNVEVQPWGRYRECGERRRVPTVVCPRR
jgi:E3 ubiquitin-protein ligase HUWE1